MGRRRTRDGAGDLDRVVRRVDRRRDGRRQCRRVEATVPLRGGACGETRCRRECLIDVDAGGIQRHLAGHVCAVVGGVERLVVAAAAGSQPRAVDRNGRTDWLEIDDQPLIGGLASKRREALRIGLALEVEI